jgi:uncharacterized Zn finger protein
MEQQVTLEMMKNSTELKCELCENNTFNEVLKIRKVSKLITGQQRDTIVPIPMFACQKCGHINKEFDELNF